MSVALVRPGYNKMASQYAGSRSKLRSDKYVRKLINKLRKGSTILDVGCGSGDPIGVQLAGAGHVVLGIDISEEMVRLAQKNCPAGQYMVGDVRSLAKEEYQVDAVVCFYTMFHIPRDEHERVIKVLASFLPRGGYLLLSMGDREWEGEHMLYGARMWSSQWGVTKNRKIVEQAGMTVELDEIDTSGGERHQVILARKK